MANVTLSYTGWGSFTPGESKTGMSSGSGMNFKNEDAVLVQAYPKDAGAAYETTINRRFIGDDGNPFVEYTVKNIGNATDSHCVVAHVIVSN